MPAIDEDYLAYRLRLDIFMSQMINNSAFRVVMTSSGSTQAQVEAQLIGSNIYPPGDPNLVLVFGAIQAFFGTAGGGNPFNAWNYLKFVMDTLYGPGGVPPGPPFN